MEKMSKIALRCYIDHKNKKIKSKRDKEQPYYDRVFVFDTETTNDEYQNLKFGSFAVYSKGILLRIGLFYNPKFVSDEELRELKNYCKKNPIIKLYTLKEFVEKVFYPEVYFKKALCVGFNLPFDLSRLAIDYSYARGSMEGGFSFKLSENKKFPRIKIKHLDNTKSFIRFGKSFWGNFEGCFLDLKTLAVTLTDEKHITLEKACEIFNKRYKKIKVIEHGKITKNYIEYNINDTLATYELYENLKKELERYEIKIPITEVYSSASLGKACLEQLGVKPFFEMNPNFSRKILGYVMSAYYGGRSEVKIRKKPVKVTVIDFLSMYPTMFILMDLWSLLIAEKIECIYDTENVKRFVENISLEDLRKQETWKNLNVIVQVLPENDILPVRMRYDEKENTFNIGVNYISSKIALWYALPDVIASKLLTGKSPKILKAIRFLPKGKQQLNKAEILGIEIDPNKENLFKTLVEKREEYKKLKEDFRQKALKILANATSYGIFVEINSKELKRETEVKVYSNGQFTSHVNKMEENGKYFNPVIAILITSGARLILAVTETLLKNHNQVHAFCDTDSMAIPPEYVKEIQEFFKSLNPYNFDKPLFKEEKKNVWFYGISAKRYVLYKKKGNEFLIEEGKDKGYSLHGLGHLLNPFGKNKNWHKMVWEDILKLHYRMITQEQFIRKYSNLFSISQLTVSTFELMKRFKRLNKGKPYEKQIKPFNFFLIGIGNKDYVKPISPYSNNPQEIVHKPFIDCKTGKILKGLKYWKSLSDTLLEYVNHKESKLDGDVGILEKRHVFVDDITYIGKETNNIEETGILDLPNYTTYQNEEKLKKRILRLTTKEARIIGLNLETLRQIKKRIKENKRLVLRKKILIRIYQEL